MDIVAATDVTPYIAGGTVIALVTAAISLLVGMTRTVPAAYREQIDSQAEQLERQDRAIKRLEDENTKCNSRVNRLIRACREGGIDIPPEVYAP